MTAVETEQIHLLPIGEIRQHPKNREPGDVSDLVESIRRLGILEPVLVRRVDDGFELIAGGRRHKAADEAGLMFIPSIVRDDLDERARVEARAIENLARRDYHPLDEAAVYDELVTLGATQAEIAELIGYPKGKGQPYISDRLSLLRLPAEAADAFRAGKLTVKQAEIVASLHDAPATLAEAVEKVAGTLDGTLDDYVFRSLAEAARVEKQTAATRAMLGAAGVRIVTAEEVEQHYEDSGDWFGLSDDGIDADYETEIGVTVDEHASEPCHAAVIGWRGEPEYFCTDPGRHRPSGDSTLKAPNLTDDPNVGAVNPDKPVDDAAAARDAQWKAAEAERRKKREAEERQYDQRVEAIRAVIATNRSVTHALELLVVQVLGDRIINQYDDALLDALGIEPASSFQDALDALRSYAAAGGDNTARFALALAFAFGEARLAYLVRRDQWSHITDEARAAARSHVDLLASLGYKPTAAELDAVATDDTSAGDEQATTPAIPDEENCDGDGEPDEEPAVAADAMPRAYKLTKPRLDALRALAFADAVDVPGAKRSSYSTTTFDNAVDVYVMAQTATWLVTEGLAVDDSGWVVLTDEGRRVATDEEVLDGIEVPAEWPPAASTNGLCEASGREYGSIPSHASGIACPKKCGTPVSSDERGRIVDHKPADTNSTDAADPLEAVWSTYVEQKANGDLADYRAAKASVIAALVDRHPDVFALTAGLAANLDGLRNGATVNDVVDDILLLLEQGGPLPTEPADLRKLAKIGDEIVVEPLPTTTKRPRRIYVQELLDAVEARP